jgi:hypothetical protein
MRLRPSALRIFKHEELFVINWYVLFLRAKRSFGFAFSFASIFFSCVASAQDRLPAVPLIAHNPYFSIWSMNDQLTDGPTRHWTGSAQPITGIISIDGKCYRFLGHEPDSIPAIRQESYQVTPTHTTYRFQGAGIQLALQFFTPALPDDLDLLYRPVTYISLTAQSLDATAHQVSILVDVDPVIAVNDRSQSVVSGRHSTQSLKVLSVGSRDQNPLNRSGDNLRIDWGYFHLAIPRGQKSATAIAPDGIDQFVKTGQLPTSDTMDMPQVADRTSAHLDAVLDFGSVSSQPGERHVLVSYTQGFAIQYLESNLRPYWQRNNLSVEKLLDSAEARYAELQKRGQDFDGKLIHDLTQLGGAEYAAIAVAAYRQTLAAHDLVAEVNGEPMLFPKENFSNGCIATVDVLYPSAPFFLFFRPQLLEAQLRPVLKYAALPRWKFPFAPHDLGQYPLANGQVYGGRETSEQDQMPVEESGNMLILVDALVRAEGSARIAEEFWPQLTLWAKYLKSHGLDPENQLTTDDFAGHVAHNANLSIKAIEAIAAYADLAKMLHHDQVAAEYQAAAKSMAGKWTGMALEGDHYKLAFDSPGTWSQKYNLVWDELLGYGLFPAQVRNTELAYYLGKLNRYGLPLDIRADYTKLDWSVWTATLASNQTQFQQIIAPIYRWLIESPSRVPLTDWYDTKNGKQVGFQARSVVGGIYIKALADPELVKKWRVNSSSSEAPSANLSRAANGERDGIAIQ